MSHLTIGEVLLGLVLTLLSVAFGMWAKKVDDLNKNVQRIYEQIHSMAIKMESRLTRAEERIHHHAEKLRINHFSHEEDEE